MDLDKQRTLLKAVVVVVNMGVASIVWYLVRTKLNRNKIVYANMNDTAKMFVHYAN